MDFPRALWKRIETIHAVTYFAEPAVRATEAIGVEGFWRGYFGCRAAPLGPVGAGVVGATFFNFAPSFVARWVPSVWGLASPARFLEARSAGAVEALRGQPTDLLDRALSAAVELRRASAAAARSGRPVFAANLELGIPDDPVAALWQLCTNLREHRGDGHVAVLTASGIDGIEAHVLIAAEQGNSPVDLQRTRGWTAEDWAAANERLAGRGLVGEPDVPTTAGRALRARIEATTDELADAPWRALDDAARAGLLDRLTPLARHISASGLIRYPNPMGLPPVGDPADRRGPSTRPPGEGTAE